MMDPYNGGDGQPVIEGMPSLAAVPAASGTLGVAVEGQTTGNEATTLKFSVYTDDRRFIDVFTKGAAGFSWTATTSQPWIKLTKMSGMVTDEDRLWASIDWASAPAGDGTGTITITAGAASKTINVSTSNPATPTRTDLQGYVESNGYVAIEAEHFTSKMDRGGAEWRVFKQLGRNGDSVKTLPDVSASITSNQATTSPELDYKIYFSSTGSFTATVYRIPTLNTTGACRVAVGLDTAAPQVLTGTNSVDDSTWSANVLAHIEKLSAKIQVTDPRVPHPEDIQGRSIHRHRSNRHRHRRSFALLPGPARELPPLRLGRSGPPGGRSCGTYVLKVASLWRRPGRIRSSLFQYGGCREDANQATQVDHGVRCSCPFTCLLEQ